MALHQGVRRMTSSTSGNSLDASHPFRGTALAAYSDSCSRQGGTVGF